MNVFLWRPIYWYHAILDGKWNSGNGICKNNVFTLLSYVKNILSVVKAAVEKELQMPFSSVSSVAIDGASNMDGVLKMDPFLSKLHIYCIIHNFMRVFAIVDDTKHLLINDFFATVRSFVACFNTKATARRFALEQYQKKRNVSKPLKIVQYCNTRWMQMFLVLKRLQQLWPHLSQATATDLSMKAEVFNSTLGQLRGRYAGVINDVVKYLNVAQCWMKVFQQWNHPTLSLVSRFRYHVLETFALPVSSDESKTIQQNGDLTAMEEWRQSVLAELRIRMEVSMWDNGEAIDAHCAAAEFFDIRTHGDLRQHTAASSNRCSFAIATIQATYKQMIPLRVDVCDNPPSSQIDEQLVCRRSHKILP